MRSKAEEEESSGATDENVLGTILVFARRQYLYQGCIAEKMLLSLFQYVFFPPSTSSVCALQVSLSLCSVVLYVGAAGFSCMSQLCAHKYREEGGRSVFCVSPPLKGQREIMISTLDSI